MLAFYVSCLEIWKKNENVLIIQTLSYLPCYSARFFIEIMFFSQLFVCIQWRLSPKHSQYTKLGWTITFLHIYKIESFCLLWDTLKINKFPTYNRARVEVSTVNVTFKYLQNTNERERINFYLLTQLKKPVSALSDIQVLVSGDPELEPTVGIWTY